jgi:hypothetical protein
MMEILKKPACLEKQKTQLMENVEQNTPSSKCNFARRNVQKF